MSVDLDRLAARAAAELLDATQPDTERMLGRLHRLRARRAARRSGVLVVVAALVVAGWVLVRGDRGEPRPADPVGPGDGVIIGRSGTEVVLVDGELAHLPARVARYGALAFTPDGTEIVFASRQRVVTAMDVRTGETRDVAACAGLCDAALSPDGRSLAYGARGGGLRVRDVATGATRRLAVRDWTLIHPRWSPDGRTLAFDALTGVYTLDVATGQVRRVFRYHAGSSVVLPPAWSPDGRSLAFFDRHEEGDGSRFTVMTVGIDGSAPRVVARAGRCLCLGKAPPAVTWSPDGARLAYSVVSGGVRTIPADGSGPSVQAGWSEPAELAWQPLVR